MPTEAWQEAVHLAQSDTTFFHQRLSESAYSFQRNLSPPTRDRQTVRQKVPSRKRSSKSKPSDSNGRTRDGWKRGLQKVRGRGKGALEMVGEVKRGEGLRKGSRVLADEKAAGARHDRFNYRRYTTTR
ncbi:hypothetical protein CEXT_24361 [Caerostris extrusa]|uniref:Uncharacterized protein n=1 Tax=Caerostris extrusa TaxID=172846 RepID=A0AAV4RJJ7_CAEEX|nr:hypothetical protein CEXT_24361 [Caerostris extrusa]